MKLDEFFEANPRIAVAFSGGVDSSYLLYAAKRYADSHSIEEAGRCEDAMPQRSDNTAQRSDNTAHKDSAPMLREVRAYYVKSQFQPQFEYDDAVRLADSLGVPLIVERMDILSCASIAENPPDRCYYCKKTIMTRLLELARADGFAVLCDGTNYDDDEADRAGTGALRELGVRSPLRECGLTKDMIRKLSKEAGLFTHDKPAYACLATRIPAGTAITGQTLEKIEHAENALFDMGFTDFRVRLTPPSGAKVQMRAEQWKGAAEKRAQILAALEHDFESVVMDMTPRD